MFGVAPEAPTTTMKIERKSSKRRRSETRNISRPRRAKRIISMSVRGCWKDLANDELEKLAEQAIEAAWPEAASSHSRRSSASSISSFEPLEIECSVGRALVERGKASANAGKWEEAIDLYSQALCAQKVELGENHVSIARTLIERGTAAAALGLLYESILDLEKALLIQRRASLDEERSLEVADTFVQVGKIQHKRGNFVEAIHCFRSALAIRRRVLGDKNINVARVICIIALAHHQRQKYKEAAEAYSEGLAAMQAVGCTKEDPEFARLLRCIADKNMYYDRVASFWADSSAI